jgi:photosystem II stability/assembly factor-like uncharacterized protein
MKLLKLNILIIFVILIDFLGNPLIAQSHWETLNVPVASRYDDVFFLNENEGFAVNSEGEYLKTTDGGKTWQIEKTFDEYLRCIEFIDSQIGFIGSLDSAFYKTTDGGLTWINVSNQLNTPFAIPGICAISIIDSVIYAGGKWSGPGYVVKSTDNGNKWEYLNLDSLSNGIVELDFISTEFGFAAGKSNKTLEGGVILKTEDGGDSWKKVATTGFPNEYVWKINQVSNNVWVGSIQGNPASKAMRYLKSEDNGETWTIETVIDTFYQSQTIGFVDTNYGVTGGLNQLFETFNGGKTWSKSSTGSNFNRFFKVNDTTAFLSGAQLYKYSKKPLNTSEVKINSSQSLEVYQNLNQLIISFALPHKSHVQIDLIDVNGRHIQQLKNEFLNSEFVKFSAPLSEIKTGVYFVVLHTNYGVEAKSVMINFE